VKILIYGAGVLGSIHAARLQEAGHDVSFLARGQRLVDLKAHGIVLREAGTGKQTITQVKVVEKLAPEDAYDLVIVIVRKNHLSSVLPALANNTHTPNVLFMLNNAAGSSEMVDALGHERVILGFPVAAGWLEGYTVNQLVLPNWLQRTQPTVFGELDGTTSPRLERIMGAFREAGMYTRMVPNMDAWLKAHAAFDIPMVAGAYAVGGNVSRIARTPEALVLMARAIQENFRVLQTLGIPVTPVTVRVIGWLPEFLLVAFLGRLFRSKFAELGIGKHTDDSPDEMKQLDSELQELAHVAGVSTPAADQLRAYLDPDAPRIPAGHVALRF
jgi:2-dehydropantoate 2-reductase